MEEIEGALLVFEKVHGIRNRMPGIIWKIGGYQDCFHAGKGLIDDLKVARSAGIRYDIRQFTLQLPARGIW